MMITEHEQIVLLNDMPENGLLHGDLGTVVSVHNQGEAYTVEFMTVAGRTVAIALLMASQVRPVASNDMKQARDATPVAA